MRNAIHIVGPIALLILLPLLSACSSRSTFWNRTPCVAGARQVAPNGCPPPQCAPRYTAPPQQCPPQCAPRYTAPRQQCPPPRTTYCPPQQPRYQPPACTPPSTQAPVERARSTQPPARTGPTHAPATVQDMAVLDRVNRIRAQHSLRPVRFQQELWVAARDHSDEQRRHGYMGHGSPDPARRSLAQRMGQAGYGGRVFAEVVAWGYSDTASVVEGWMNSTDHRRILLDPELTEAGFSRVGQYWTGNLGAPARYGKRTATAPENYTFRRQPAPQPRAVPSQQPQQPRYTPARKPAPQPTYTPQPRRQAPAPARQPAPRAPIGMPNLGFG